MNLVSDRRPPRLAPFRENRLPLPVGGQVWHFADAAQEAMRVAGMTWVKWQISYSADTDLALVRDRITRSHEAGFLVLLNVIGDKDDLTHGGAYLDAYAEFLGELARLGADAIEVWREMNLDRIWPTGKIDPKSYAIMLQKAFTAIKEANTETLVITGALAPTGAEGVFGRDKVWNDDYYYAGMAGANVADSADCIGFKYTEGMLPPTAQAGDPRGDHPTRYLPTMLRRVAYPFRGADIPMCMTELGYLAPESYGPLPIYFSWAANTSVAEQAAWLSEALLIMSNYDDMPVELAVIWNIDFEFYGEDLQAGYAIIRPDGSCPSCEAIAKLQR